jgi:hypothetical protein
MRRPLFIFACFLLLVAGCAYSEPEGWRCVGLDLSQINLIDTLDSQLTNRTPKEQLEHDLQTSIREASERLDRFQEERAQEKALRDSIPRSL